MKPAVGIDIVEFDQFRGLENNASFLDRVFCSEEIQYCKSKSNPLPYIAARFAVKEAVIKALGGLNKPIYYSDIEITKQANGSIEVALHKYPEISVSVSLSHGQSNAVAVAFASEKTLDQKDI